MDLEKKLKKKSMTRKDKKKSRENKKQKLAKFWKKTLYWRTPWVAN